MLECLDNRNFLQIHCIAYVHLIVVTSTCYEISIHAIRHASHFFTVQLLMSEALLHVQIPNGDRAIAMTDSCKAIQWVTKDVIAICIRQGMLRRSIATATWHNHTSYVIAFKTSTRLLLIRKCDIVHLWIHACIYLADCFLASDVKQEDFLVCRDTYGEWTITCHLYTVDVATMTT